MCVEFTFSHKAIRPFEVGKLLPSVNLCNNVTLVTRIEYSLHIFLKLSKLFNAVYKSIIYKSVDMWL